jgi:sialate O-acetylesterase
VKIKLNLDTLMFNFNLVFIIIVMSYQLEATVKSKIVIPSIFSNDMVLQHNTNVPFWGKANPGDNILIKTSWGITQKTITKNNGNWKMKIRTANPGGPYKIILIVGDSIIRFNNVLLGEVWLCSGQSNMTIPLEGWLPENPINNSAEEISDADYPLIRLFTVIPSVSYKPRFDALGKWSECTQQTAAKFSAVAYFFGRELYNEIKVPIGLILSSWGATRVQDWISSDYLLKLKSYQALGAKMDSLQTKTEKLMKWNTQHPIIDISKNDIQDQWKNLYFSDSICFSRNLDDKNWITIDLPSTWKTSKIGDIDGVVWFRRLIKVPENWVNKNLVLNIGPIHDMNRIYVNGELVGKKEEDNKWGEKRVYSIPGNLIRDTIIAVAIRVIGIHGDGGIWGEDKNNLKIFSLENKNENKYLSIAGKWKCLPVAEYIGGKFYVYNIKNLEFYDRPKISLPGPDTPSVLYNGMISPLIPYHIKGVIWYQGERNSHKRADYMNYEALFHMMINNWRAKWCEGQFPFYFVQIAPFDYTDNSQSEIVRNAQLQTYLSTSNTGIVATLDIGSLKTIHPPNKQEVGRRLALWALSKNYHKNIMFSGPIYKSMKIECGRIMLTFKCSDGGLLMKKNNSETNFIIAGKDHKFFDAQVEVKNDKLIVYSNKVKNPVAVRYAWNNSDEATLFNKSGLPAPTFKTDNWMR